MHPKLWPGPVRHSGLNEEEASSECLMRHSKATQGKGAAPENLNELPQWQGCVDEQLQRQLSAGSSPYKIAHPNHNGA